LKNDRFKGCCLEAVGRLTTIYGGCAAVLRMVAETNGCSTSVPEYAMWWKQVSISYSQVK
jgi:hypothetical protein